MSRSTTPTTIHARPPLWIVDGSVNRILTYDMAMDAVSQALTCHARKDYDQPLKPYVRPRGREQEKDGGRFIAMPAFVGGSIQAAGVKWIGSVPSNIERGIPRASGLIVLNDLATAVPIAVMECSTLSARRTAAVAALSFDLNAPLGSRIVAILGAGPINSEVVAALSSRDRNIASLRIFDPREDRAKVLAEQARAGGLDATITLTAKAAVTAANVVITATVGTKGYIKADWLEANHLIIALSLDDFEPEVLLSADKVICDDFDQSAREEKLLHRLVLDGRFSRDRLYAELGEIVAGMKPGRENNERIYVNPMGMAIEDIATAAAVYREYESQKSQIDLG